MPVSVGALIIYVGVGTCQTKGSLIFRVSETGVLCVFHN